MRENPVTIPSKKREGSFRRIAPYIGVIIVSCLAAYAIGHADYQISWLIAAVFVGIPFVFFSFTFPQFGLLSSLSLAYFIFFIKRITYNYELPVGLVVEILLITAAVGVLVKSYLHNELKSDWYKNRIAIAVIVWISYLVLQALNPYMTSLAGWQIALRGILSFVATFYVCSYSFSSIKFIRIFTWFWVMLALLTALYGLYQEIFELPPWDHKWVTSSKDLYALNFIGGRFRKFSFLGNVSAQGIFMSFSAIFCLVMLMGPYSLRTKVLLGISIVMMLLAMAFSGTRTAYVMVPAGLFLYVMMTINNQRTLVMAIIAGAVFFVILFGPIYTPTVKRIRSAFFPEEDASMQVRNKNRGRIQPYILSHPIGGGIGTTGVAGRTYSPGHELAGFPPDSGYLELALEMGWIGLFLNLTVKFIIMYTGIHFFYRAKDPEVKILYAAYLCAFFSVTIAHFAQVATGQLPNGMIYNCIYVLMIRLIEFDKVP